jgi:hypothetical protein
MDRPDEPSDDRVRAVENTLLFPGEGRDPEIMKC